MNFTELGLSPQTVKAIEEIGITQPSTVQADVIPSVLEGKDVFTIAPGRCGKTYSYVFPLLDIIARKEKHNILIITADSAHASTVSDRFAIFNKYHEEPQGEETNVVIASPDLILELVQENNIDLSHTQILVVDDINLIKTRHQLSNLEKVLEMLPAEKQNIVFTNRRSKETQSILDKILQTPTEIKVDKAKEDEASTLQTSAATEQTQTAPAPQPRTYKAPERDELALEMVEKYNTFEGKTPAYLLYRGELVKTRA